MSIWHLMILLLVVVVVFGTGKLRNAGSDLGSAIRDFKKGLNPEDEAHKPAEKLRADPPPAESVHATQEQREPTEPK